jgi:predicted nucleic acid-binding protein
VLDRALAIYQDLARVHFADAYVAAVALERDCALASFDRALRGVPRLRLIGGPQDLPA